MNYHSNPQKAGPSKPTLPITYDANMNPRNVFLLDGEHLQHTIQNLSPAYVDSRPIKLTTTSLGKTPASVQERLAAVLEDNRRRKEAKESKEAEYAYQFHQSSASHTNLPGHWIPNQDNLAQPFAQHQETESNYFNIDQNLQPEGNHLENSHRSLVMGRSVNDYSHFLSNVNFVQRGGDDMAGQHVLTEKTYKNIAYNQSVQLEDPNVSPIFGQATGRRSVSHRDTDLDTHGPQTLTGKVEIPTTPPTNLISPSVPNYSQAQYPSFERKRRPRNGGHIWRNYNHFSGSRQQRACHQSFYQQSARPQYVENGRRTNVYDPVALNDEEAWAKRRYETGQISPLPNYFTHSTTFSESHSGSVTPTRTPLQGTNHDIQTTTFPPATHYPSDATHQFDNRTQIYDPHTITSMNSELDLPPFVDPYASQFSVAPSRKLQRRNNSFVPSEEDSQTSSGNYKGNPRAGIRGLSDHLNCALWLTNLAADIQAHEVFDEIHTGAVTAFEITRPQGEYVMSAAKLVFKYPEAAARFKDQCESEEGIVLRGRRVNARYNTFGYCQYKSEDKTRMISIEGPSRYVVYDHFKVFFETFCDHELSGWEYVEAAVKGNRKMLIGFARINGQATQCLEALQMHPVYGEHLIVQYAPDPCAKDFP
ncbi:uncharacterized protein EAE97_010403 [Botrytis byssoidea]|uniref:RRM domain-containing protein n=1 Tax=Botrytis byssoidea TaxID=139641 RepID=A0A9P5HXX6_9HELO|nr:uncharacterized protein EAE97_010403 [Botrytis byssoidea]KAF7926103.1 hypothetical protein EAE97_010403 [Botrytis byssoidea]